MMGNNRNLIAAIAASAAAHPDKSITMYNGRCKPIGSRSFAAFLEAGKETAGRLKALGVGPGDRVIICLSNSWDWYDGWLGAVYLGAYPVSAAPGFALGSVAYQEEKIFAIAERLEAKVLICGAQLRDRAGAAPDGLSVLTPDELAGGAAEDPGAPFDAAPGDVAYLQLTSGSTGFPKAAEVTHGGMMHNVFAIHAGATKRIGTPPKTGVFWLPLFHDFGLVMSIGSVLTGLNVHVFPPAGFLSRPGEYFKVLGAQEAVLSGGPNFSAQHAATRVSDTAMTDIDLSGWHTCVFGAEMNRIATLDGFLERFADAKCPPAMMAPGYGMAEATLVVSMDQKAIGPRTGVSDPDARGETTEVICCGEPLDDTFLRIVDDAGNDLPDGAIGEILIKSPGLVRGYFRNPEATDSAFLDGWFKSGDLGFIRDGELYITGRLKDILIINGTNYMPHELESLAEREVGSGGMARAAAFTVTGTEQSEDPVLVVELERAGSTGDLTQLGDDIGGRINRETGIPIRDVIFVPRGTIPRTTSGKIQRSALKAAFEDGSLARLNEPA